MKVSLLLGCVPQKILPGKKTKKDVILPLFEEEQQNSNVVPITRDNVSSVVEIHQWSNVDKLFNAYESSINSKKHEKVLDILDRNNLSPNETMEFLTRITSNEKTAEAFINEVIKDDKGNFAPQKSGNIVKKLVEKLGGKDNFKKWYFSDGGYLNAFKKYGENFYKNAKSIEELYAFSPAWGSWALRRKFEELKQEEGESIITQVERDRRYHEIVPVYTDGYTIGTLPPAFKDKETFRELMKDIRDNLWPDEENLLNKIQKYGFSKIKIIRDGYSNKIKINLDDKYIIKAPSHRENIVYANYMNELCDMVPDSVYMNSMIDYYTNFYAEGSAATMYYYDDLSNAAIYEFVQGSPANISNNNFDTNNRSKDFDKLLSDIEQIGLNYTDYNRNNFINCENNHIKCIDSGHSVYSDILKPIISGLQISLPSRSGLNPLETEGRLSLILSSEN